MRGSEGTAKFSLPLLPVVPRISSLSVQGGNLPEREVRGRGREARKTLKRMVVLVSRHGRRLQRYSSGRRLVVGCIPYKLKEVDEPCSEDTEPAIEVLVVSSQKGPELMFPKGGWELDESMPEAASREAFEEAGVRGSFELVPVAGHAWQMDQQGGRQDPLHVRVESYGGAAAVAGDGRPRTEVGDGGGSKGSVQASMDERSSG
ncbi:Nudix hydrolase [Musa troglodytarum]|uniref:Nudix hydrolase n=1 Tax=Musa troglodytarum TaxID=320322 RepID=A0A9E7FHA3_9LILI|nr:Nudix hydrolase [Musa troglodytarum]